MPTLLETKLWVETGEEVVGEVSGGRPANLTLLNIVFRGRVELRPLHT